MYNHEPEGYECYFCILARGGETEYNKRDDIIYDDGRVLAQISPKRGPNNPGNVLVIPHSHIENVYDMPDETLAEVCRIGKKVALAMKESYKCEGISFQQNNEPASDQIAWHFHLHVVPRWKGDDLYANDKYARYVTREERKPYADKLRGKV